MSKGISNIVIEKLFKEINNDDLNQFFFFGVYSPDKINKFVMFEKMMLGKYILSWFQKQTEATKVGCIGGV